MYDVQLLRIPVQLNARAQEHGAELMREMYLIAEQLRDDPQEAHLPVRLVTLVDALTAQYAAFTTGQARQLDQAIAEGAAEIDLHYNVPKSLAEDAARLDAMLDEADRFCLEGKHLLTLATPPELVRYRRWHLGEFSAQLSGRPPTPWPDYAAQ